MRPLHYSINVTLDGCCHHEAGLPPDEESMSYWTAEISRADALLYGRVTYEMMQAAWRKPETGAWPDWMNEWEIPFAETIDRADKYVVSSTLESVDWNAELVRGDLERAVRAIKEQPGEGLWVGGVTLPPGAGGPGADRRVRVRGASRPGRSRAHAALRPARSHRARARGPAHFPVRGGRPALPSRPRRGVTRSYGAVVPTEYAAAESRTSMTYSRDAL